MVADGVLTTGWRPAPMRGSLASSRPAMPCAGSAARRAPGRRTSTSPPASAAARNCWRPFRAAILVTELIGLGVNRRHRRLQPRRGGFPYRHGEITGPVAEITIASNLKDMFATLEPASDLRFRRGVDSPTLLVPEMTVASA